jgi:hypothetical protein
MNASEHTRGESDLTKLEVARLVASCYRYEYNLTKLKEDPSYDAYCSATTSPSSLPVTRLSLPLSTISAGPAALDKDGISSKDDSRLKTFFSDPFSKAAPNWIDYYSNREWYIEKWGEVVHNIGEQDVTWDDFRDNSPFDSEEETSKVWLLYCHSRMVLSYLKKNDDGEAWLEDAADVYHIQKWLDERWRSMGIVWLPWRKIDPLLHTLRENFLRSHAACRSMVEGGWVDM